MPLFDSSESIGWTNLRFITFKMLTIKWNPLLSIVFLFLWYTVNKLDQKVQSFSQQDSWFWSACLLTLSSFPVWCWLAKFWQNGQQGAAGSIGGSIQICVTWLQALAPFSLPVLQPLYPRASSRANMLSIVYCLLSSIPMILSSVQISHRCTIYRWQSDEKMKQH